MTENANIKALGRVEKVSVRDTWSVETDFNNWLSEKENLKLLGGVIGVELHFESREKPIERYRVDIICNDGKGRAVVIENKFEAADHDHLGKAITCAAREDAAIIIWVAEEFRRAELDSLEWLNQKANGSVSFFGIKIEVWKIGNSEHAPQFQVVNKPQNWLKNVKPSARRGEQTETQQLYDKYWATLIEFLAGSFQCGKSPAPGQLSVLCPVSPFHCGFYISVRELYVEVYFSTSRKDKIKLLRSIYEDHKMTIEREKGEKGACGKSGRWVWVAAEQKTDPSEHQRLDRPTQMVEANVGEISNTHF